MKDLPNRVQAAHRAVEKAGGKFLEWNLTMGLADAFAIIEIPDDESVSTILLEAGKSGNIQTTTLKAFSEVNATKIIAKLS